MDDSGCFVYENYYKNTPQIRLRYVFYKRHPIDYSVGQLPLPSFKPFKIAMTLYLKIYFRMANLSMLRKSLGLNSA